MLNFQNLCEDALLKLSQTIEAQDKNSKLDVEYSDGILEIIIIATKQTYIINRNSGNQKIWYSSPFTGADYFSFDGKFWVNAKGEGVEEKLGLELKKFMT
jgi:iron donor protein CyaY